MTDVEIRPVLTAELPQVAGLRWRSELEHTAVPAVAEAAYTREFVEWAERHADSHHFFVALRDGAIIGMACLSITARMPTPMALERACGDLQSVYLVPEERARGRGSLLVAAVLEFAADQGLDRVTVQSGTRAIPVYARNGFESSPKLLQAFLR